MKKRYLALFLVLCLLLTACGSSAKSQEAVSGKIEPITTEPAATESAAEERPVTMGRMEGGNYVNEYAGFGCNLDSSWTFYSAEELQDMPENVKEMLEGSELGDSINTVKQFTDMLAENLENLTTMNVLYQELDADERIVYAMLDERDQLELALEEKDMLIEAYAQGGFDVQSMEIVTVNFLGQQRSALKTASTTEGVPYYTLQLFDYGLGRYSVTLTLASFVDDNTEALMELFYPVS